MIPEYFHIGSFGLFSLSLFVLMGVLFFSFVVWREGRREGFDEDNLFDMVIVLVLGGITFGRFSFGLFVYDYLLDVLKHVVRIWEGGFEPIGSVIGATFLLFLWAKGKKWSVQRIFDVVVVAASFGIVPYLVGYSLIYGKYELIISSGLFLLLHSFATIARKNLPQISSTALVLAVAPLLLWPYFENGAKHLILIFVSYTLASVIQIRKFRSKKHMAAGISKDFLKNIKEFLVKKDKQLAAEESLLTKEDSYNVSGRDVMNSEAEDEAVEDASHVQTSILKRSVEEMRLQIRKALAKINVGTYGICELCHKPIDPARLKAFPQATTCLDCAEKTSK